MIFRHCSVLACGFVVLGCGSSARVVTVYENESFENDPFSKILVIGIHEDATLRRRFEVGLVDALRAAGTDAVSSTIAMGSGTALNSDTLAAATRENRADGVLITRLLDVQARTEMEDGRATAEARRRDDVPIADVFRYEYEEYQDPMTVTTIRTVVLANDLYDADAETRVWSAESTAIEKESVSEIIESVSASLVGRLDRDGLIL